LRNALAHGVAPDDNQEQTMKLLKDEEKLSACLLEIRAQLLKQGGAWRGLS
jgi:hypothetical protein